MKKRLLTWMMLIAFAFILVPSAKVNAEADSTIELGKPVSIARNESQTFTFVAPSDGLYVIGAEALDKDAYGYCEFDVNHDDCYYQVEEWIYGGAICKFEAGNEYEIYADCYNSDCSVYVIRYEDYKDPKAYDASKAIPLKLNESVEFVRNIDEGRWFTFTAQETASYHILLQGNRIRHESDSILLFRNPADAPNSLDYEADSCMTLHVIGTEHKAEKWMELTKGQTIYLCDIVNYGLDTGYKMTLVVEKGSISKDLSDVNGDISQAIKKNTSEYVNGYYDIIADTSGNAIVNKFNNFWTKFWNVLFNDADANEDADNNFDGLILSWGHFWDSFMNKVAEMGTTIDEYKNTVKDAILHRLTASNENGKSDQTLVNDYNNFKWNVDDAIWANKVGFEWNKKGDQVTCKAYPYSSWDDDREDYLYYPAEVTLKEEVSPTCDVEGYKLYVAKANIDGYAVEGERRYTFPPTGHVWNEITVTKEPTATEKGEGTYICNACGATKVEEISPNSEMGQAVKNATEDNLAEVLNQLFDTYDTAEEMKEALSMDDLAKLDTMAENSLNGVYSDYYISSSVSKYATVEGLSLNVAYYSLNDEDEDVSYYGSLDIYKDDPEDYEEVPDDAFVMNIEYSISKYVDGEYDDELRVEPKAPIRITMSLPDDVKGKNFELYHYGNNGKEKIDYTLRGDYITFVVTSFSPYAFEFLGSETTDCEHEYTEAITKAATCTQAGIKTFTCSKCDHSYNETIPATGHSYDEVTTEATCGLDGKKVYTCSKCGDSYTETIPATGDHSWGEYVTDEEPSCVTEGSKTRTCDVCGAEETAEIPATGHDYVVDGTTAPTCEEAGEISYTCSKCGDSYTDPMPALGHDYKLVDSKNASYTAPGYKNYECTRCGNTRSETIAQLVAGANTIIVPEMIVRSYTAGAQSFALGATCYGGAALSYVSNNPNISVNAAGLVTVNPKYMGNAVITITAAPVTGFVATAKNVTVSVGPTKTSLSSAKNVKGKKIQLKWKKNKLASGYQIQLATDPNFTFGVKGYTVSKNKTTSKTISKLVKGKTYYVRIRSYKKTATGNAFAVWSATKKVVIKK